jgi:hypothetical protein
MSHKAKKIALWREAEEEKGDGYGGPWQSLE